jgi:hypothetical protein
LWWAAAELLDVGFSAAQFGLLGSARLFNSCETPWEPPLRIKVELDGLLATDPTRVRLTSADVLEMRCGQLVDSLFTAAEAEIVEAGWMRPDLARSLARDVASGCFILLVASSTAGQHAQGARLLLRHGNRNLQTHEFSVSQPDR